MKLCGKQMICPVPVIDLGGRLDTHRKTGHPQKQAKGETGGKLDTTENWTPIVYGETGKGNGAPTKGWEPDIHQKPKELRSDFVLSRLK
jgi:hypothetical protein